tara:strand:- start:1312 stop:2292 length:981 start_codon:yes stop_codon:yes gene_type:complete
MATPLTCDTCDAFATVTTDGYDLSVTDGYALLLDGNMDITASVNDDTYFNDTAAIASNDTARFLAVKLLDPLYYIKASYDINGQITVKPGNDKGDDGIDGSNDDAWELTGFSVNDTDASDVTSKLPTNTVNINGAQVTATDNNELTQIYTLRFDVSVANDGDITVSNKNWTGNNVTGSVVENILAAQAAHWVDSDLAAITGAPAPGQNDKDTLTADLTIANVNDHWYDEAAAVMSHFDNQNALEAWKITVDSVPADPRSNLSAYAQNRLQNDSGLTSITNDVFAEDDQIVLNQPFSYELTFDDNLGANHTLMPNTNVYGVLFQKTA